MKKPLLFLAVAAALYLGFIVARSHLQSIQGNSQQNPGLPAATPPAPPFGTNSFALATPFSDGASAAERPSSITLLKPGHIRFKKGGKFLVKSSAPLFYRQEYLGDAAPGQQLQILDYNPETRRVYLWWNNPNGNPIAVNTLDLHGACKDIETVPANTVVALKSIADGNALVEYNGDRFFVPVSDTNLRDQAAQWRGQNELPAAPIPNGVSPPEELPASPVPNQESQPKTQNEASNAGN